MALSTADREYLGRDWRWVEYNDLAIRARHVGAREAEYATPFVTLAGAEKALGIIRQATSADGGLVVAVVDAVLNISFASRPPMVRLFTARFGGDPVNGRLMIMEQATIDHSGERTTLYLKG